MPGPGGGGCLVLGGCLVPGGAWSERGAWSGRVAGPGGCLVPGDIWSGGIPGLGVPGPGGAWSGRCLVETPPPLPRTATATGGTHPTGMHSCCFIGKQ